MPYTPPPRDAVNLVVGGSYTPPPRDAVNMQLGDDPLLAPTIIQLAPTEDSITVTCDTYLSYNPHATHVQLFMLINGAWTQIDEEAMTSSTVEFVVGNLNEGTQYQFKARVIADLYPTDRESPDSDVESTWTDYLLQITQCTAGGGIGTLQNALVIALPEEEFLEQVERSQLGTDWPPLSYKRANKTDANGQCTIRIPGGKGRVWVIMIPPRQDVGGDAYVHIESYEE